LEELIQEAIDIRLIVSTWLDHTVKKPKKNGSTRLSLPDTLLRRLSLLLTSGKSKVILQESSLLIPVF